VAAENGNGIENGGMANGASAASGSGMAKINGEKRHGVVSGMASESASTSDMAA